MAPLLRCPASSRAARPSPPRPPIASIPYTDVGFTCNSIDDYYPSCAFFGISAAPDVVYSFVPHDDTCARISLCGSGYDTCVHVYDGNPSTMVACNDDDPEGNCGLQSGHSSVTLLAGHTYYIVVDGFDVDCGDYYLDISECPPPCVVECPPGSALEGEPACFDDYVDSTNGGCNSAPPVYTNIPCNDGTATVCGTTGTYLFQGAQYRDTDWYQFTLTTPTHVKYCINAETTTLIAILDGTAGCPPPGNDPPILCFQFGNPCTPVLLRSRPGAGNLLAVRRTGTSSRACRAAPTTSSRWMATAARRSASSRRNGRRSRDVPVEPPAWTAASAAAVVAAPSGRPLRFSPAGHAGMQSLVGFRAPAA
jgi:hypothetical protein